MNTLIAISGLGIVTLILEILNLRKIIVPFVLVVLLAVLGMNIAEFYGYNIVNISGFSMLNSGKYLNQFYILFILLAGIIIATSTKFYSDRIDKISDFVSLKLFVLAGAIAMVGFSNLIMFFLGLEVLSISIYALASSKPEDIKSNESGMKYFLMGAVASAFVLFGIALVYGAMSAFDTNLIHHLILKDAIINKGWYHLGITMICIGMFFKASIFPFQFWAPDVYQGAPTINTALMSTLVKVAALASFFMLGKTFLIFNTKIAVLIAILGVLTMTIANLTALRQKNLKRMMAYSGIAHAGFMIMFMMFNDTLAVQNDLLLYCASYSLAALVCFLVIMCVCQDKNDESITNFYGLFKKSPVIATAMIFSLMSLSGIPFLAGFFAKFVLFIDLIEDSMITVAILCVINSIIAVYYYFNIINSMFKKDEESTVVAVNKTYKSAIIFTFGLLLILSLTIVYITFF